MTVEALPNAIDLSHHLNALSKSRFASPLKDIMKYMLMDGMVSLAGGLPHPSLFPFADLSVTAFPPTADVSVDATPSSGLVDLSLTKYAQKPSDLDLHRMLQYGHSNGLPALLQLLRQYTQELHQPAYADWDILLDSGNTDGVAKAVRLLCEPGEYLLCEEYTFASSIAMWTSFGCLSAPVKLDGSGLRADDLDHVLANWETTHPGKKRPHVLYLVPTGSNPSGSTMPAARRKEVYDVCSKYDVIILEDDPYAALQFAPFEISDDPAPPTPMTGDQFKDSLEPSFLKFDREGRVIRLESFSKTLAPGNRLGFFIANPLFTERLLRGTEVETQTPSGWAMGIVYELLRQWGIPGYLTWLSGLRDQYETRRNHLCGAISKVFTVVPAAQYASGVPGAEGIAVYPPGTDPKSIKPDQLPLFSLVAPTGGMFLWSRHYLDGAKRFRELAADGKVADPEKQFMDELWQALADNMVLLTPGSYYVPYQGEGKQTTKERGAEEKIGFFRWAFSTATHDQMLHGVERMEEVLKRFYEY